MLEQVFQTKIQKQKFWQPGEKVIVATSTGVDSMVLLWLLLHLPKAQRPQIIVAHVNHELRVQSDTEEAYLQRFCQMHHVPLRVQHWPQTDHPQTGIEAAARAFRYTFFAQVMQAEAANYLLTAHHGDDLLETLLMKLIRSGELHEMRGIRQERPFESGTLIRPLLPFSKQEIRDYAAQVGLIYYEDQTNHESTVLRNRIRHAVVPLLKQENPRLIQNANRFSQALTNLMEQQASLTTALLPLLAIKTHNKDVEGRLDQLTTASATQQRALWQLVWHSYFKQLPALKLAQLDQIQQLLANRQKPQGIIELGAGLVFEKQYGHFRIGPKSENKCSDLSIKKRILSINKWLRLENDEQIGIFEIEHLPNHVQYQNVIWLAPKDWPLQVKPVVANDRIMLDNTHHKTIQRLWIDTKTARSKRHQAWAIWAKNQLIGRPDLQISALFNHEQTGKIRYILCYLDG
ncbi:tRNA lysidine(34) synthetase TilS [Latilactobacillus graminis]|uniref:tRNA(Ile)-lysidine synthase n=2 Tax=Latilactobacillus graminis TaxID=60519 RepID=A0AA89I2W9_9LACO|nr:tRNA lysidine(34) synthetase TilS [Latilactobacillus graminis]KRM24459.1 tRNA(Ile)-lysidine synthetase [Latilactobacillus graminis DSM 20719]QFP79083.1 tRNA lysidine(34) synthetase TilS [Latilactobacillus graminis]